MKKRITSVTSLISVLILSVTVSRAESVISKQDYQVRLDLGVMIPMRYGVKLSSDFCFPDAEGGFPTILIRTPYNNSIPQYDRYGKFYAGRGYVVVIQDCRGRYDSEGEWYPYLELLILERMLRWNTGKDPYTTTDMVTADQAIYHNAEYPSHIVLPIIERED